MRKAIAAACLAAAALPPGASRSSLLIPPARNAVDKALAPWANDSYGPGQFQFGDDAWGCNCINATTKGPVPCEVGQSCFWFSNGCSIGCKTCDGGNASGTNPNTVDHKLLGKLVSRRAPKHTTP